MGGKLKFVVSDLHLGAGYAADRGYSLEDFTADQQFVAFLRQIAQESESGQHEVELLVNGDLFEFLQVPAVDPYTPHVRYPREAYLDSTEAASVRRLNIIIEAHPDIFNALSDFMHVETPQRRITIIKGNHDVNLFWPGVKSRLREVLGATGPRASLLLFAEEFVSREKIYIEHGHQRLEEINRFPDFLDPRRPDQPTQLYYPAGSRIVIDFFNEVEYERWFIDSIKPLSALIWYAFRWDFEFAVTILLSFLRYAPGLLVSNQAADAWAAPPPDIFIQELEDEQKRPEIAGHYRQDPDFRLQFHRQVEQRLNEAVAAGAIQSTVEPDAVEMARAAQRYQRSRLRQAAEEISRREGAEVVLFGHIHSPVEERLDSGGIYLNTGCWLWSEDFSDAMSETWQALFEGTYQFNPAAGRLPYVRIEYDDQEHPRAKLEDFARQPEAPQPSHNSQARGCLPGSRRWLAHLLSGDN